MSIISNQPKYLSILLESGGDPNIRANKRGRPHDGLNAFELQELIKKRSREGREEIDSILSKYKA